MNQEPVLERLDNHKKRVMLSHGVTEYYEMGSGPPVILLHGVAFWSGGDFWMLNIEALSQRYRVLAPDFLGWGYGDRWNKPYSFAYLTDFVREFQDALGITKAHIVGHSMGGWIGGLFAYESPQRLLSLTLVSAGGLAVRTLASMTEFQPPTREQVAEHVASTFAESCVDQTAVVDRYYAKTRITGAVDAYRLLLQHMNDPANRNRYHLGRRLAHVSAPTLIVWGDRDPINDTEMARRFHQSIRGSELALLPCGHFAPTEEPSGFNKVVDHFFEAVSS